MNKKAIAILGAIFLLIVGTLGFLVYSKYSNKAPATTTTQTPGNTTDVTNNGNNNNPSGSNGDQNSNNASSTNSNQNNSGSQDSSSFFTLAKDQIVSPILFFKGDGISYFDTSGKLYKAPFDQNSNPLTVSNKSTLQIEARPNIAKVFWPSQGENFIVQFSSANQNGSLFSFFDSEKRSYLDLPPQVTSLDWIPSGDKIIFVWTDKGKSTLNMANPDTSGYQYLSDMWENDDEIHVSPDGKNILFYETANSSANNKITMVSSDGKIWKDITKDGFNFGVLWSADSQKFLFAKKDRTTGNYQLWYSNIVTGEVKNLGLFTTVDKAVWDTDSKTVYASVPISGQAGSGSLTSDSFFKVNVETMDRKEYKPSANQTIDGNSLLLSINSDKLFFKNAQDGWLYYLDLTK